MDVEILTLSSYLSYLIDLLFSYNKNMCGKIRYKNWISLLQCKQYLKFMDKCKIESTYRNIEITLKRQQMESLSDDRND